MSILSCRIQAFTEPNTDTTIGDARTGTSTQELRYLVLKLTLRQIEAVLKLSGSKRYEHFVKVVADQRKLWGLFQEGWAMAATEDGMPVFPVWPAEPYAQLCAQNDWSGYDPRAIDLDEFFEELIPRLRRDGVQLGVFYTPSDRGVLPSLEQIEFDLRSELSRIE